MVEHIKDITTAKLFSLANILSIVSVVVGIVIYVQLTYATKVELKTLYDSVNTIKTRQDFVLINQVKIMEKMGIIPTRVP